MGKMNKAALENATRRASTVSVLLGNNPINDIPSNEPVQKAPKEIKKPILFKVETNLKEDFAIACKISGSDVTTVLTKYMEKYVSGMKDQIDDVKRRLNESDD